MKKIFLFLCLFCASSVFVVREVFAENLSRTKQATSTASKKDALFIAGQGGFSGPLVQQQIAQDGQSGLAYQKPTYEKKQPQTQSENQPAQKRRLRAVEKVQNLSASTFDADLQKSAKDIQGVSFKIPSMEQAAKAVKKENTQFIECLPDDKSCSDYKVDETGEVIW